MLVRLPDGNTTHLQKDRGSRCDNCGSSSQLFLVFASDNFEKEKEREHRNYCIQALSFPISLSTVLTAVKVTQAHTESVTKCVCVCDASCVERTTPESITTEVDSVDAERYWEADGNLSSSSSSSSGGENTVVGQVSGGTGTGTGHVIRNRCRSVLTHSLTHFNGDVNCALWARLAFSFSLSPVCYPLITANSI